MLTTEVDVFYQLYWFHSKLEIEKDKYYNYKLYSYTVSYTILQAINFYFPKRMT